MSEITGTDPDVLEMLRRAGSEEHKELLKLCQQLCTTMKIEVVADEGPVGATKRAIEKLQLFLPNGLRRSE